MAISATANLAGRFLSVDPTHVAYAVEAVTRWLVPADPSPTDIAPLGLRSAHMLWHAIAPRLNPACYPSPIAALGLPVTRSVVLHVAVTQLLYHRLWASV